MQVYRFSKETGKKVTHFDSDFFMTRLVKTTGPVQIGCMHLEEDGVIGYHEATVPQLLLIVSGEGEVLGKENECVRVYPGTAVFWEKGEWHKTQSENGLTAIVIESEELSPDTYMEKLK